MTIQLPRVPVEAQEGEERVSARAGEEPRTPGETDRTGEDLKAQLDKLQEAANTASAHARNVYLTFLLFGLYLAIIFGSTTHEQLLRETPVTLPLLDVGLPLVGFYWVAPALFVLLHLNLLLELYLLSSRLHRLDKAIAASGEEHDGHASDQRLQIYPFPFSQMLIGRQHGRLMRLLFWLIVWLTVLVLPIVLLLAGQVRFLPYHDAWTTMWHRALVAADLLLILIFWRVIRHPADRLLAHPGRWLRHQAKVLAGALPTLVLSFLIFTFPGDPGASVPSKEQEVDFGDLMEEWLLALAPKSLINFEAAQPTFRPTSFLFENLPFLDRNLTVQETNLVGDWPTQAQIDQYGEDLAWENFGAPPSLRERDLRYADFSQSIFVRGDLRSANLQGAYLGRANLQGADLSCDRPGNCTNLQGADLRDATLQSANLRDATLQGAYLVSANFQGAYLWHANLQGAYLWHATLQSANLRDATLQGADLRDATLQSADLASANLQGANLRKADLQGADLASANLQGAVLHRAKLWGAALNAELSTYHLADLRRLDLEPPAQSDLKQWIADAKKIADEQTRKHVLEALGKLIEARALDVLSRLRQELGLVENGSLPWQPNFPPGLAEHEDVLFKPVPPPMFAEFDPKLAKFLAGMACDPNAPSGIAVIVANRAIYEDEPGRLYPAIVAKALLGVSCPPAKELDNGEFQRLRELLVGMQPSRGNAGSL